MDLDLESNYKSSQTPKVSSIHEKVGGVTLRWKDLTLSVENKDKSVKHILKGMNGEARGGEFIAILGPSGAGKSSLLDCLAGRNKNCKGEITVNGQSWDKEVARVASYVVQDDVFYPTLTVQEHLMFQAKLRMGSSFTMEERASRVEDVLESLGLSKCRDTLIGNERVRGVSGGERKRLSFATELLTNPSLFFVDEPTSGLDSYMAETVVLELQKLAHEGRTVIATIHQPSSELYELFDRLLLIADGDVVYLDKTANAVDYFSNLGYPCPKYANPCDYFMRTLALSSNHGKDRKELDAMKQHWKNYEMENATQLTTINGQDEKQQLSELAFEAKPLNLVWQIAVLCRRNIARLVKDRIAFNARLGQNIFLSLIVGLIFLQLDNTQKGIQNFSGAIFFLVVNRIFGDASPEFMIFPLELPIVLREHRSGLYYSSSWFFAKNISELIFQVLLPLVFITPAYFLIGFGASFSLFVSMAGILILLASCATGMGYMVACICGKPEIASIVGPIIILPFLLFGGLFLNPDDTPVYFTWLQFISPIKYGYEALMNVFWNTIDVIPCEENAQRCLTSGSAVLENLNLDENSVWFSIFMIIILNIAFRIIALLGLMRYIRRHES